MFDDQQKIVQVIQDTLQLLQKAMKNLSSVIDTNNDPVKRKRMKSKAKRELSKTINKHFS